MNPSRARLILKREFRAFFGSPAAYVFIVIFLFLANFFTFMMNGNFFARSQASLDSFFQWVPLLGLVLIPAVGMSIWAEERRNGTIELLFTMPVKLSECIIGKFLAAWLYVIFALLLTFPLIITVGWLGSPDYGVIFCGYLGSALIFGVYLAVTVMTSAMTRSQVVSFILAVLICLFLMMSGWPPVTNLLVEWAPPWLLDITARISVTPHFTSISRGVIDSRDIIYYLSLAVFAMFVTGIILRSSQTGMLLKSANRVITGGIAIILGLFITIAVNVIADYFPARIDFTAESLYTLSQGTKNVLAKLPGPVTIRLYCTKDQRRMPNQLKNYAEHVEDLLTEYRQAANGKLIVEKLNPAPDSDAADAAAMDGVTGQLLSTGDRVYLGLAVSALDKTVPLPYLSPGKEGLLEYDITRAITQVARDGKPVIGVMSALPVLGGKPSQADIMRGGRMGINPTWLAFRELMNDFKLVKIPLNTSKIRDDLKLLVVMHPAGIDDVTQFAIDQFIMRGGRVLVFLDPRSFYAIARSKQNPAYGKMLSSDLPKLLPAWKVSYSPHVAVADMKLALRGNYRGRMITRPTILELTAENLNKDNVSTSHLENIELVCAGALAYDAKSGLKSTVLMSSTTDSQLVSVFLVTNRTIPLLLRNFKPDKNRYALGINLTGKFASAFPDGAPGKLKGKTGCLKSSEKETSVTIIADSDLLMNNFCVRRAQNLFGGNVYVRKNDNINLLQNLVEHLSGDQDLIRLRCRTVESRPLTVFREIRSKAEQNFKNKIVGLENELRKTQTKINKLNKGKISGGKFILSPEQRRELKEFTLKKQQAGKELKKLRKQFRAEIIALETRIKWINLLGMPVLIILAGLIIAIVKRKRNAVE